MRSGTPRLALIFTIAVVGWLSILRYGQVREPHPQRSAMDEAARLAERAFAVVDSVKRVRGLAIPSDSTVQWRALLGEDYTPMTTTLGSRPAKEVSTNPGWAALLVGMLAEAGVQQGDTVGVLASGSFPALTLSALSALSALKAEPLLMTSLGASSFGANTRGATILDLEEWVREAGILEARSILVSPGGENDAGGGLSAEGREWLEEAAARPGTKLVHFESLDESISLRTGIFNRAGVTAVVNIGGGQSAVGRCPHAAVLPVGMWSDVPDCRCENRGVLTRMATEGVPVINLLSIRRLAAWYGLDTQPGIRYNDMGSPATRVRPRKPWVLAVLAFILLPLVLPERIQP